MRLTYGAQANSAACPRGRCLRPSYRRALRSSGERPHASHCRLCLDVPAAQAHAHAHAHALQAYTLAAYFAFKFSAPGGLNLTVAPYSITVEKQELAEVRISSVIDNVQSRAMFGGYLVSSRHGEYE